MTTATLKPENHPLFRKNAERMGLTLEEYKERVIQPDEHYTEEMLVPFDADLIGPAHRRAEELGLTFSQFCNMVLQLRFDDMDLSEA